MTPLEKYQDALSNGSIVEDTQQRCVVKELERIYHQLQDPPSKIAGWLGRHKTVDGLYVWGSVGAGKTFLIDLFYDCITVSKRRQHFFEFIQEIQQELNRRQGQKNPIQQLAAEIAKQTKVICFDEFFVTNIADAMVLGELFIALFKAGIVLVTTSNIDPDNLYADGLQRERFIPAIEAIKAHCHVIHLNNQCDYRLHNEKVFHAYLTPLNNKTDTLLNDYFNTLSSGQQASQKSLTMNGHQLTIRQQGSGILWCDFDALCVKAFSQRDYLVLAKQFHTVILSNVPIIPAKDRNSLLRFIYLIDILYDTHTRLIVSAAAPANELYPKGPHAFEFERTASRLIEMQSDSYFNRDRDILQ